MAQALWNRLLALATEQPGQDWLPSLLARNSGCAYLELYGSPRNEAEFRESVPLVQYDQLTPWLDAIANGEAEQLFAGRPVAYERTGGSSSGAKLIPFSAAGLDDFRKALLPWLARAARRFAVRGRLYLSLSPATRPSERIGGVPVGLPDGAYLGSDAGAILADLSVVPLELAAIQDVEEWRSETIRCLENSPDLELISCWSPTFMLRLLEEIDDPVALWPRLRLVSCWASASSAPFADDLATRLPTAHLQPKGLMSTECVVTVPDDQDRPVLNTAGFFEFLGEEGVFLGTELQLGSTYEVVATTASGLYRYRTGDFVRCDGYARQDRPILEFVGRSALTSDLVGEKLTEPFISRCLASVPGFRMLVPASASNGYLLCVERGATVDVEQIESQLCANPQYAYARRLGQLKPLRLTPVDRLFDRYVEIQVRAGVRLGDIKPNVLRTENNWLERIEAVA